MGITFTTFVKAMTEKATTLPVPNEAVAALGKERKPRVVVTLNGYTFRSTIQVYGGQAGLPFHAEDREGAGVQAGDQVEVTMTLDLEPRTVEVPDELAAAMSEHEGMHEKFDALAYSKRKEFARQVTDAKTQETRTKRIAGIISQLSGV
ncbi:MAG: YdeI/OmpD-associated family protein [Chloroflexia bacterium]